MYFTYYNFSYFQVSKNPTCSNQWGLLYKKKVDIYNETLNTSLGPYPVECQCYVSYNFCVEKID